MYTYDFALYQMILKPGMEDVCKFAFMPYQWIIDAQEKLDASLYEKTYQGIMKAENDLYLAENVFKRFNNDHPNDFYGRSMSVSDLLLVRRHQTDDSADNQETPRLYYCDMIGFKELNPAEYPQLSF